VATVDGLGVLVARQGSPQLRSLAEAGGQTFVLLHTPALSTGPGCVVPTWCPMYGAKLVFAEVK
jgi:hypothetical protein